MGLFHQASGIGFSMEWLCLHLGVASDPGLSICWATGFDAETKIPEESSLPTSCSYSNVDLELYSWLLHADALSCRTFSTSLSHRHEAELRVAMAWHNLELVS